MPPPTTNVFGLIGTLISSSATFSITLDTAPDTTAFAFAVAPALSVCTHETCSRIEANSTKYGFKPAFFAAMRNVFSCKCGEQPARQFFLLAVVDLLRAMDRVADLGPRHQVGAVEDRQAGEMPVELRFVHGDVLHPDRAFRRHDVLHLVDKKEGITVRDRPQAIWSLRYQGQPAFYVQAPCCDQFNTLHDAAGATICVPDGGFIGRGDGNRHGVHLTDSIAPACALMPPSSSAA